MINKKYLAVYISMFVVLFVCIFALKQSVVAPVSSFSIGGTSVNIEKAITPKEREIGLSGRNSLAPDSGLLFVFEKPNLVQIWMKDMKFPIDIVWIDANLRVVYIKERAIPESFPEIFTPPQEALYVLELNAGFVEKNKIKIGDKVVL